VTGTVTKVEVMTMTVIDSSGTAVTVLVPVSATVTSAGLGGLSVGDQATVTGTKAADGTITATSVTTHR
jgi:hypothetical protein